MQKCGVANNGDLDQRCCLEPLHFGPHQYHPFPGQYSSAPFYADTDVWWAATAKSDHDSFAPKLQEYGAHDLVEIGRDLARMSGRWDDAPERVFSELGAAFYLRGKVARMMEAYARGDLPSDDTLHDMTVYSMMLRRIRDVGTL